MTIKQHQLHYSKLNTNQILKHNFEMFKPEDMQKQIYGTERDCQSISKSPFRYSKRKSPLVFWGVGTNHC